MSSSNDELIRIPQNCPNNFEVTHPSWFLFHAFQCIVVPTCFTCYLKSKILLDPNHIYSLPVYCPGLINLLQNTSNTVCSHTRTSVWSLQVEKAFLPFLQNETFCFFFIHGFRFHVNMNEILLRGGLQFCCKYRTFNISKCTKKIILSCCHCCRCHQTDNVKISKKGIQRPSYWV